MGWPHVPQHVVADPVPWLVAFSAQAIFPLLDVMDAGLRFRGGESLRELQRCFIRKVQLPSAVGVGKRMLIRRTFQTRAPPQALCP
jgi:hypothetical protein